MGKNNGIACGSIKLEAEAVLDCLDWDILIMDRNFHIIFANRAFLDKIGTERCDVVGQCCYKMTHHLDHPCQPPHDTCPLEEMFKTGKPAIETHTHFGKGSEQFLANTITAPLNNFGQELFLHLSIPIKDAEAKKEETESALDKALYILNMVSIYQKQMDELRMKREELERTKVEMESKVAELERFNKLVVDREIKMIELKKKMKETGTGDSKK